MKLLPASHLSQRGSHTANYRDFIMTCFKDALKNPYHPKSNPEVSRLESSTRARHVHFLECVYACAGGRTSEWKCICVSLTE